MFKLILLLALALRLPLMFSSLWLDEAIEALALMGKMGPLLQYALADFQPPIYHFILSAWTTIAGYSEFALRTPSLLAGLGVVYFSYKLGHLLSGYRLANLTALLVATNPLLIYYSAEGRTYILTTFFITASFYYLLQLLRHNQSKSFFILYSLFTILSLWSSYLTWIIIGLQFIFLLLKRHFNILKYNLFSFATLILWLPSLFNSLKIGLSTVSHSPQWGQVVGGLSLKAVTLTWIKLVIGRISFQPNWLYLAIVIFLALFHFYILKQLKSPSKLLLFVLIFTPIIAIIISLFVPVYAYFRLLFLVPLYLVLLALGLVKLPSYLSYTQLLFNLIFIFIFYLSPQFHHEDWRSLTNFLNQQSGTVAMPSLAQNAPLTYYQLNLPLIELRQLQSTHALPIYYIRYVEDVFDPQKVGLSKLKQLDYKLSSERTYSHLQLEVYEKD